MTAAAKSLQIRWLGSSPVGHVDNIVAMQMGLADALHAFPSVSVEDLFAEFLPLGSREPTSLSPSPHSNS